MNTGTLYDKCATRSQYIISTCTGKNQVDLNKIWNRCQCFSYLGPRAGYMGNGVSTPVGHPVATSQKLVDIDSILSNRNMRPNQRCYGSNVNNINVTKLPQISLPDCGSFLDPISTNLITPSILSRGVSINRFLDINKPAQVPLFWNFAIDTRNEAKDNYRFNLGSNPLFDITQPVETKFI